MAISISYDIMRTEGAEFFFLERAKDLRINILRRKVGENTQSTQFFFFPGEKNKPIKTKHPLHTNYPSKPLTLFSRPKIGKTKTS
jgi:hypothetical protein